MLMRLLEREGGWREEEDVLDVVQEEEREEDKEKGKEE